MFSRGLRPVNVHPRESCSVVYSDSDSDGDSDSDSDSVYV